MGRIFDVLCATLDEERISYDAVGGHTALRFGFRTEQHAWASVAEVQEGEEILVLVGIVPGRVEAAQRAAVAELLMRLNLRLQVGNFELDFDDGQVRFRTAIDFGGGGAAPALIRQLVRANLATVARHAALIAEVSAGA
jgi:hypothetical protein